MYEQGVKMPEENRKGWRKSLYDGQF
jgi:hypothetical protein